jgi:hypothetical protein
MDGTDWEIKSKLDGQWEEFLFRIEQLHNSVDFSEKQSPFDFEASTKDVVTFDCKPFSINLPERAGSSQELPLFLVIRGKMTFDKAHFAASKEIRT